MHKGANNVTLQKYFKSFLIVFQIFYMKLFLNEILCKLSLKIHIAAQKITFFKNKYEFVKMCKIF
jgi:hypothetical protein